MAVDSPGVKFLCAAKRLGADFDSVAMIGRQWLFADHSSLSKLFQELDIKQDADDFKRKGNEYSEGLFRLLGATSVESVDASSYEDATHIHDMNLPLPELLKAQYSFVYDGGTLEHVFNFSQALKNCMEMVAVGGHFAQCVVSNNYVGHGFWQVSPEAIFRALSPRNGFKVVACLLHEVVRGGHWYAARDPDRVKDRVQLANRLPTYMFTLAQRTAVVPIFAEPPQQADYARVWAEGGRTGVGENGLQSRGPRLRAILPPEVRRKARVLRGAWRELFYDQDTAAFPVKHYQKIGEASLLRGDLHENTKR